MRSRTELVTTTLEGSEFEEDTDLEDSEEDWKPERSNRAQRAPRASRASQSKSKKRKAPPPKRKSRAAAPKKKWKKKSSSEEEEDSESEKYSSDDEPIQKMVPTKPKNEKKLVASIIKAHGEKVANSTVTQIQEIKDSDSDDEDAAEPEKILGIEGTSKENIEKIEVADEDSKNEDDKGATNEAADDEDEAACIFIQRPLQRKYATIRSLPDRNGLFELLVCKSELKDGIKDNFSICLWRRDGSSLLQKYIRDETEKKDIIFRSSSVYSCWEESKRGDYYDVKVQSFGAEGQTDKVKILNADELETIAETLHTDEEDVEEEIDTKNEIKFNEGPAPVDEDEDKASNDEGEEQPDIDKNSNDDDDDDNDDD